MTDKLRKVLEKEAERFEREQSSDRKFVRPRKPTSPAQVYSVRIPVDRIQQLRRVARRRKVAPSALMREWVVQRLDDESISSQSAAEFLRGAVLLTRVTVDKRHGDLSSLLWESEERVAL